MLRFYPCGSSDALPRRSRRFLPGVAGVVVAALAVLVALAPTVRAQTAPVAGPERQHGLGHAVPGRRSLPPAPERALGGRVLAQPAAPAGRRQRLPDRGPSDFGHRPRLARGRRLARPVQVLRWGADVAEHAASRFSPGPVAGRPRLAPEGLQRRGRSDGPRRHERTPLLQRHRLQPRHQQRRRLRGPLLRRQPEGKRRRHAREGHDQVRLDRLVDTGTSGQFIDKPWLAVDIPRAGAGTCTFNPFGTPQTFRGRQRLPGLEPVHREHEHEDHVLALARLREDLLESHQDLGVERNQPGNEPGDRPGLRGDLRDLAPVRDLEPAGRDHDREVHGLRKDLPVQEHEGDRDDRPLRSGNQRDAVPDERAPDDRRLGRRSERPAGPRRLGAARRVHRGCPDRPVDVHGRRRLERADPGRRFADHGRLRRLALARPPVHARS